MSQHFNFLMGLLCLKLRMLVRPGLGINDVCSWRLVWSEEGDMEIPSVSQSVHVCEHDNVKNRGDINFHVGVWKQA